MASAACFPTRRREDTVELVPRIDARTLAEHRELHHARLLGAALEHVSVHGVESLTLAELAKRTGRSRASLYAYFGSAEDLRAAVCEEALRSWVDDLVGEVRQVQSPDERLDRFVTSQIHRTQDPAVDAVLVYVGAQHGDEFRARVLSVTEPMTAELLSIIDQLGVQPPERAATIVQGAVAAAYDQVRAGADPASVARDTVAFIRAGIAALRRAAGSDGSGGPSAGTAGSRTGAGAVGHASGAAPHSPGALASIVAPSMPAMFATALSASPVGSRPSEARRPSLRPVSRLVVGISALTAIGFVSGVTGIGGSALHLLLGIALVGLLAWSVRAVAPARSIRLGLRTLLLLAVATSVVALLAAPSDLGVTVAAHVAFAVLLLVGTATATASAVRCGRAMTTAPPL